MLGPLDRQLSEVVTHPTPPPSDSEPVPAPQARWLLSRGCKGRRLRTVLVPQPPSLSRARADRCSPGWKGGPEGSVNPSSEAAQRPQPGALNPRHRPYRKPGLSRGRRPQPCSRPSLTSATACGGAGTRAGGGWPAAVQCRRGSGQDTKRRPEEHYTWDLEFRMF